MTTRVLIDEQLRATGWKVDSATLRHANGIRPTTNEAIAIAEWPTQSGPVDYALFVEGRCVGAIKSKAPDSRLPGRIGQAKRYARYPARAEELIAGCFLDRRPDQFRVPFVFVTNGRPYVKQLATKPGIWLWTLASAGNRALAEWFSPRDLVERLSKRSVASRSWRSGK